MQTTSLRDIHEGMKVFDSSNRQIGTVDWVKLSEDDPETPQIESAGLPHDDGQRDSLIENLAEAFRPDDLPEEVRERLLNQGFVRIDADGWFSADRYVTPEQIQSVSGDAITLSVSKDDLLKRT